MTAFFNTGLSQQQFLEQYWQKKPLLIRNAFNAPVTDLTPEILAGIACEEDIESRLIRQLGPASWSLQQGPLDETDFSQLPEIDWTLLVQDMDKHWPALKELITPFRFIPDWRRDDIMISYAVPGGSVGAHIDNYDVFLLQAEGVRRWQIGDAPIEEAEWLDDCQLRILKTFNAAESWDLAPGDMLYLPPKYAHHGIAQTNCMTISVGFRAPTQRQLLDSFVDVLAEQAQPDIFYSDADLTSTNQPAEINEAALQRAAKMLMAAVEQHPDALAKALGRLVTETKSTLEPWLEMEDEPLTSIEEIDAMYAEGGFLERSDFIRLAYHVGQDEVNVFIAGQYHQLSKQYADDMATLCTYQTLTDNDWQQLKNQADIAALLLIMLEEGAWVARYQDD
ncbi:JmjC domain-containing protein [Methylophaga sp. OBS3]|uniref:JmjC domain-containing protein n=1 Tax=Methylophaga sp. OBS3 TaxID=2991934 RepID=UPI0022513E55|nr:cupin domain-containing protein [Methylophaga sp. OBS3]MCX4190144.1 cupin domain-containing protein [Methylophaga sp. OBS3]